MPDNFIGEVIGVTDIFIAEILKDDKDDFTVGTPEVLAPTASIAEDTPTNQKPSCFSNQALFIYTSEGASKLTCVIPGISTKAEAMLLGKVYDDATGLMYDSGSPKTKYFAFGFRSNYGKVEGGEGDRYVWFLKGSFAIPKREAATKTEQIDNKPLTVEYSAISTIHKFQLDDKTVDGAKRVQGDTSDVAFDPSTWFDAVVTPPEVVVTP